MILSGGAWRAPIPAPPVRAAEEPQVSDIGIQVEGRKLEALVINLAGRTLVPLRAVGEVLGAVIGWDEVNRVATLVLGDRSVSLQIGSRAAIVVIGRQSQTVMLDVPALLFQDRTYVPARFVAEALGFDVSFDDTTRTVTIAGSGSRAAPGPGPAPGTGSTPAPGTDTAIGSTPQPAPPPRPDPLAAGSRPRDGWPTT